MDLNKATDNWRCPDCKVLITKRCNVYRHVQKWCKGNYYAGLNRDKQKKSFDAVRSEMPRLREARNLLHESDEEMEHVFVDVDVTESEHESDVQSVSA